MKALQTEIEIKATPEQVWEVLTHFGTYRNWNPFLIRVDGEPVLGHTVRVRASPPRGRDAILDCTIITLEPGRELCWRWKIGPGLYGGEHSFRIEPAGEGRVRLIDREEFRGLLLPILGRSIDSDTRAGFEAMDRALKAKVEAESG